MAILFMALSHSGETFMTICEGIHGMRKGCCSIELHNSNISGIVLQLCVYVCVCVYGWGREIEREQVRARERVP